MAEIQRLRETATGGSLDGPSADGVGAYGQQRHQQRVELPRRAEVSMKERVSGPQSAASRAEQSGYLVKRAARKEDLPLGFKAPEQRQGDE